MLEKDYVFQNKLVQQRLSQRETLLKIQKYPCFYIKMISKTVFFKLLQNYKYVKYPCIFLKICYIFQVTQCQNSRRNGYENSDFV